MPKNPELRRNLWLEITRQRLIAMPLILGIVFFILFIGDSSSGKSLKATLMMSKIIFVVMVICGIKKTASSVVSEVNQKTWDFQKLSSISPWQMTIGKFVGSSLYTWYGAIIALIVYTLSLYYSHLNVYTFHNSYLYPRYKDLTIGAINIKVAILLLSALLAQTLAMFFVMSDIANSKDNTKTINEYKYIAISALIFILFVFFEQAFKGGYVPRISWYGMRMESSVFCALSLFVFLFWSVFGTYRLIKKEFQYKVTPWVWCSFVIFLVIYLAGVMYKSPLLYILPYSLVMLIVITYLTLFMQSKSPIIYKKMLLRFKQKKYREFFEIMPLWMVTYIMAVLLAVFITILLFLPINLDIPYTFRGYPMPETTNWIFYIALSFVPILIMSRDILIVHFFQLSSNSKRGDFTSIIYLAILYMLVPAIFYKLKLYIIAYSFIPLTLVLNYERGLKLSGDPHALWSVIIISASIQLFVMYVIFMKRWKEINKLK